MTDRERFTSIVQSNIHRDGTDKLMDWLNKSTFFDDPASARYHLCTPGGLCTHSLHVYDRLMKLFISEFGDTTSSQRESISIVALFHDLCKIGSYKTEKRNVKDENGKWQQKDVYVYEDKMPYGHGEKSVYIVNGFLRLTRDEAMAIRWHMGFSGPEFKGGDSTVGKAFEMYPLAVNLHIADLQATYLDESDKS